jgi:hypothetical protein
LLVLLKPQSQDDLESLSKTRIRGHLALAAASTLLFEHLSVPLFIPRQILTLFQKRTAIMSNLYWWKVQRQTDRDRIADNRRAEALLDNLAGIEFELSDVRIPHGFPFFNHLADASGRAEDLS